MGTEQMQLVVLKDKTTITNSLIIGEVFGKDHNVVLRAIRNLIKDVSDSQAQEHLCKIAQVFDATNEKRREFGEGAGKLIGEPIHTQPPTAYDMELAKAYDKIVDRERNELDTDKCQFFKLTTYESVGGNGRVSLEPMYEMNEDGFALLVMGFTGPKATMFKVRFIKEFNRLKNLVNQQLLLDSQQLHRIENRHAWQGMDDQIRDLKSENRALWEDLQEANRKITVMTKDGRGYLKAYGAIRKEAIQDVAGKFYVPAKATLRMVERARSFKDAERAQWTLGSIEATLRNALDAVVDVGNAWGRDLEDEIDEDTIARLDGRHLDAAISRFSQAD